MPPDWKPMLWAASICCGVTSCKLLLAGPVAPSGGGPAGGGGNGSRPPWPCTGTPGKPFGKKPPKLFFRPMAWSASANNVLATQPGGVSAGGCIAGGACAGGCIAGALAAGGCFAAGGSLLLPGLPAGGAPSSPGGGDKEPLRLPFAANFAALWWSGCGSGLPWWKACQLSC